MLYLSVKIIKQKYYRDIIGIKYNIIDMLCFQISDYVLNIIK